MIGLIKRFTWNRKKKGPSPEEMAVMHINGIAVDLKKMLLAIERMIERLDNNQRVLTEYLMEETKRLKLANEGEGRRLVRAESDEPNLYDRRY